MPIDLPVDPIVSGGTSSPTVIPSTTGTTGASQSATPLVTDSLTISDPSFISGVPVNAGQPVITLAEFIGSQSVATTLEQEAQRRQETTEQTVNNKAISATAATAQAIAAEISAYYAYQNNADKTINKDLPNVVNPDKSSIDNAVNNYNNDLAKAQSAWGNLAQAAAVLNNLPSNATQQQIQDAINNYNSAANAYNSAATTVNNDANSVNAAINNYNQQIAPVITEINTLNTQGQNLVPPPALIPLPPSLSGISQTLQIVPVNGGGAVPPFPNGIGNPGQALDNYTVPTFDDSTYSSSFLAPLIAELAALQNANKNISAGLAYITGQQLQFGQNALGYQVQRSNNPSSTSNSGPNSPLSSNIGPLNPSTNVASSGQQSILNSTYNTYGAPSGSPLVPVINGFVQNFVTEQLIKSANGAAVNGNVIAGNGVVGPNVDQSQSVQTGVAIANLQNIQALVSSGQIQQAVLAELQSLVSQGLIQLSPADLEQLAQGSIPAQLQQLAQGIAAGITSTLLSAGINQLGTALGTPGLAAQLLAQTGVTTNANINNLTNKTYWPNHSSIHLASITPLHNLLLKMSSTKSTIIIRPFRKL